jgi:F-type H+-transporting ATPase subunit alpha
VIVIYAATSGYLDSLEVADCLPFEQGLLRFIENSHPSLGKKIADKKQLDDSLKAELNKVLDEFKERFATERKSK